MTICTLLPFLYPETGYITDGLKAEGIRTYSPGYVLAGGLPAFRRLGWEVGPSLLSFAVTAPLQGASFLSSSFPFLRFQGFSLRSFRAPLEPGMSSDCVVKADADAVRLALLEYVLASLPADDGCRAESYPASLYPVSSECVLQAPIHRVPEEVQHVLYRHLVPAYDVEGPIPVGFPREYRRHHVISGKVLFAHADLHQLDCGVEDLLDFRPVGFIHELGLEQLCNAVLVLFPRPLNVREGHRKGLELSFVFRSFLRPYQDARVGYRHVYQPSDPAVCVPF